MGAASHPLLGAVLSSPDSGGVVLTGRLSVAGQPWLADHVVAGRMLLPGTGFVELVVRAGDQVGCGVVRELTLQTPLVLSMDSGTQVQVVVAAASNDGERSVSIYSRDERSEIDDEWTLHAQGTMGPHIENALPIAAFTSWPPQGAEAVPVAGLYERLAESGYDYGPVFRGLQQVWRRGEDVFAEVALPESVVSEAGRFGLHPALLDAALHALLAADGAGSSPMLPFEWQSVRLHATGATTLRARLSRVDGGVRVEAADAAGQPVLTAESLTSR
ncbi:polyketide synthase dehydratase domain-containing protein, partial [Nocardia sp. NPDC004278]